MKKIKFLNTELSVAPLCLGTVNYGSAMPEKEAIHQLSRYVELGGNFIDTAHIYGDWEPGMGPLSETAIGKWLKEFPERDRLVISTKGAHPRMQTMQIPRCSDAEIEEDLNSSLELLHTDYVDLYFLHRDDPRRPAGEIVEFLEKQVKAGKICYYGCSNWKLSRVMEANAYAKEHGLQGFVCNQLMWSLADVNFSGLADQSFVLMDQETYSYQGRAGLNAMAYMSVATGYFTRRAAGEALPKSVTDVYDGEANDQIFSLLKKACGDGECSMMDYALRYLMEGHPFPSVPIASFDNDEQLAAGMGSVEAPVDPQVMEALRRVKKLSMDC